MAIARFRTFLGIAKEVTPGTAVNATDYITITSDPKSKDIVAKLDDKSWRGSAVQTYAKVAGTRQGEIEIDGNMNPASFGYLLSSVMGDVSTVSTTPVLSKGVAASGGTFAAGTYFWVATAVVGGVETVKSNEVTATLTLNQQQPLSVVAIPGATQYKWYRSTTTGTYAGSALVATTATNTYTDTGTALTAGAPPAVSTAPTQSHSFAVKNNGDGQPTSFTITDYDGDTSRQFAAAKCESLNIKFGADGLVTYTAKFKSFASVNGTVLTPTYSTVLPIASWTGAVTLGGSAITYVMSGEIDIKRAVEVVQTVDGNPDPFMLFSGAVAVTGKLQCVLQTSDPNLADYLANNQKNLNINFAAAGVSLSAQLSSAYYTMAEVGRSKEYAELAITFEGVGNTTDAGASGGYSPAKFALCNSLASGTYA